VPTPMSKREEAFNLLQAAIKRAEELTVLANEVQATLESTLLCVELLHVQCAIIDGQYEVVDDA